MLSSGMARSSLAMRESRRIFTIRMIRRLLASKSASVVVRSPRRRIRERIHLRKQLGNS